jgi:integrase
MKRKIPLEQIYGNDLEGNPVDAYGLGNASYHVRKMIRSRTNKEGLTKVSIEVRIHNYGGTGRYEDTYHFISTNIWINPKHWNKKKEEITPAEPDADTNNKAIEGKYLAVKAFVNSKGRQKPDQVYAEGLDLSVLAKYFPSYAENRKCLTDFIDDYITFRKNQNTNHNTLKEFTTMMNRVKKYDKSKGKKTHFEDISITWSDDFEFYLRSKAKNGKAIGYNEGTIEKTYTILKTVLNHYYDRRAKYKINLTDDFRITGSNGFKRGKKSINEANPLTKDQLDALYLHQFEVPHLQLIKDRFIWQCYTGIRFIDAFTITKKNIKDGWLRLKPSKTIRHNIEVIQPLNDVALEILQKYDYDMTRLSITNQAYNRELKVMFQELQKKYPEDQYPNLKYKDDYGSYGSRDTFITMCVDGKANWKNILQYVGQSSYAIMSRYVKADNKQQEAEIQNIFKKPVNKEI